MYISYVNIVSRTDNSQSYLLAQPNFNVQPGIIKDKFLRDDVMN